MAVWKATVLKFEGDKRLLFWALTEEEAMAAANACVEEEPDFRMLGHCCRYEIAMSPGGVIEWLNTHVDQVNE